MKTTFPCSFRPVTAHCICFNRSELRNIEYQPRSLMPDDYGSRLSREELDDLVSYLASVAQKTNKPQTEQE